MAIEAVKIPQNVYVEDRIVGPVTLRQLIITGLGAGLSYAIYAAATKSGVTNIVTLVLCWVPALIAAMFAFLKINDLTLFNIILLMIEGMNKPSKRVWDPGVGISINIVTKPSKKKKGADETHPAEHTQQDHILEMTRELQERERQLRALTAQADVPHSEPAPEKDVGALPVNRNRIKTDELHAHLSLDGIMSHEHMRTMFRSPTL